MSSKRSVAPPDAPHRRRAPLWLALGALLTVQLACATFRAPTDSAPTRPSSMTVSVSPPPAVTEDVAPTLTLPPSATPTFLATSSPAPLLITTHTPTPTP